MTLANKVAFVSGASRGIGRATAEALAVADAVVAINFHSHAEEAEHVAEVARDAGRSAFSGEAHLAEAGAALPWGRLGQPEEIARAVVFLCDPASDYITGSLLLVDGGFSLPKRTA
jgi:NAD(P)-dependent dehydrogenase (short-subunit alcohol dehydrogenase family)